MERKGVLAVLRNFVRDNRTVACKWGKTISIFPAMQRVFFPELSGGKWTFYPLDGNLLNTRLDNLGPREASGPTHLGIICNETSEVFASAKECSRVMKLDFTAVGRVANGKRKSHAGHTFTWLD